MPGACGESTWWHRTYAFDWLSALLLFGVAGAAALAHPPCPDFSPLDPTIGHPHTAETIPDSLVVVFCLLAPWLAAGGVVGLRLLASKGACAGNARSVYVPSHDLHNAALSIAQAVALALAATVPIKNSAGRLRPDFLDRLRLELDLPDPGSTMSALADLTCNTSNPSIIEGRRSFPSGHSSLTFAGWTALGLFAAARLRVKYRRGLPVCVLVALLAGFGALPTFVALSRVHDYRHHYDDIFAGACIGIFCGLVCFNLHHSHQSS
eukprot:gene11457-17624_t